MLHIYLQVSQTPNKFSSMVLSQKFLICQRQQRIAKSLKEQKVAQDEILESFDFCVLFPILLEQVALEVLNRKYTEHINKTDMDNFP